MIDQKISGNESPASAALAPDYAPSPNTCSAALTRANQLRVQALLRQLLVSSEQFSHRLDTLRVLRKTLRELDYNLSWLTQVDFLETLERLLREEERNPANNDHWRLINDSTQLLIEAIPKFPFQLDAQTIGSIFPNIIQNLGHQRSEVRRASLLLINMYINERPAHFEQILRLFVDYGLANYRNQQAQRGAILSLPLLMTEQVVEGQNLGPLIRCLGELLVEANSQLFYSLYLALQRLHLTLGDSKFNAYLRDCNPEARLLYEQAASRNNSIANPAQRILPARIATDSGTNKQTTPAADVKQVTFGKQVSGEGEEEEEEEEEEGEFIDERNDGESSCSIKSSESLAPNVVTNFDLSSVSSTCSSQANLVEPSHYMSAAALEGRPLSGFEQIHHIDHSSTGLTINDINVSCTPTMELGPNAQHELKFGIFPKHLVQAALHSRHTDRLEALEEMMCIIRDSPINHLAILITYFDSFLEQFLAKLMGSQSQPQSLAQASAADYKLELIAIDMIETIVIKTKISTIQYIRPIIGLLIKTLTDSRAIFRDNTIRVIHKMMAFLPPQYVIDAIFEHKHNKSALLREESINRVTAAVLEYDKNEFNLTKLCYHILPMLADHHAQVRLAALECIATLAHALGPDRIGSLLTAAEAVQTGCDYDGLLDSINARLMRRALPRCNSNGSIRYVIKPFLNLTNANYHKEHEAADVRWVLEAPSSHQHVGQPQPSEAPEHHAPHRPGAYSPPAASQRRASVAPVTAGLLEHGHRHHHHHHQPQQQQQQQQRYYNNDNDGQHQQSVSATSGQQEAKNSPLRESSAESFKQRRKERSESKDLGQLKGNKSENRNSLETKKRTMRRRSNSQESCSSSSSTDTNKILFQFYLNKFKQSLAENCANSIAADRNGSLMLNSSALPSDSIIYTDTSQAYALSRNQSRFQQTSFEYDSDSANHRTPDSRKRSSGCIGGKRNEASDLRQPTTGRGRKSSVRRPSREEQQVVESSSGGESPQTVMEAAPDSKSSSSHQRRPSRQMTLDDLEVPSSNEAAEASSRRRQSVGAVEFQRRHSTRKLSHQESQTDFLPPEQCDVAPAGGAASAKRPLQRSHATLESSQVDKSVEPSRTDYVVVSGSDSANTQRSAGQNSADTNSTSSLRAAEERESRRRRSTRRSSSKKQSDDELAVRRRASRSQPPALARQMTRTPSRSGLADNQQQLQMEAKRSASVSPSVANSVNIRQILENVAELEGPFQEAQLAFKVAQNALESPCWSTKVEGILALIRLAAHHQPLVVGHAHEIVGRLCQEVRNLRSTVARSAIFALGDLCARLKRSVDPEMETIVQTLLQKSTENTAFIREDIRKALASMSEHLTQWRLANALIQHGSAHKNVNVRRMSSQFVALLVEQMGAAKCLVGARDISAQLIPAAAKFAQDSSPHTRFFGRLILARLMQHGAFERLTRKNLAPNMYRSTLGIIESVRRRGAGEMPAEN